MFLRVCNLLDIFNAICGIGRNNYTTSVNKTVVAVWKDIQQ